MSDINKSKQIAVSLQSLENTSYIVLLYIPLQEDIAYRQYNIK